MATRHSAPTWSQPALLPPEFVALEVRVVFHGASGTANVSVKLYDPDGDACWHMEVVPVLDAERAQEQVQVFLAAGLVAARALVPPF